MAIQIKASRLAHDRSLELQTQPRQIGFDCSDEVRPGPEQIEILDPQQKTPSETPRKVGIQKGGKGVAKMKATVRARSEPEDAIGHGVSELRETLLVTIRKE